MGFYRLGNRSLELLGYKIVLSFKKRREFHWGGSEVGLRGLLRPRGQGQWQAQNAEYQATNKYFHALKPMRFALLGLRCTWEPWLPISSFWNGHVYPIPVPPLYVRNDEIWDLGSLLAWVKTFEEVGEGWMYFVLGNTWILKDHRVELWLQKDTLKSSPLSLVDLIWKWSLSWSYLDGGDGFMSV